MSVPEELERFFNDNPVLYGHADVEDIRQLTRIYEIYPDMVRLLDDASAIELEGFKCLRCGACCFTVKYITVSHSDVRRWVAQGRCDILEALVIDRRRSPLASVYGKDRIDQAKAGANMLIESNIEVLSRACSDSNFYKRVLDVIYLTGLLESSVYVGRRDNKCIFLGCDADGVASCMINDTKPRVCEKFPYYIGRFTDSRLVKQDSFCPGLREAAVKLACRSGRSSV